MKLLQLLELAEPTAQDPATVEARPFIDKICKLVFMTGGDWIADPKRGAQRKYYGVANERSVIFDKKGEHLHLTFDNSTDSGEYELNSLSRLMIEKGGELDKELLKLYKELDVKSSRKIQYTSKNGKSVIREIYFGKVIDERTIRFVQRMMSLFIATADPQK